MHPIPSLYWNSLEKYRARVSLNYFIFLLFLLTGFIIFLAHLNRIFTGCFVPHIHKKTLELTGTSTIPQIQSSWNQVQKYELISILMQTIILNFLLAKLCKDTSSQSPLICPPVGVFLKLLTEIILLKCFSKSCSAGKWYCAICVVQAHKWFVTLKIITEGNYLSKANKNLLSESA